MVLETGKDSDLYTLSDIVRSKRKLAYGSGGVGSLPHTNMAYISHILATPMTHIPYQGAARSLTDLSAGRIDLCFDFYNSSRPLIQDGRIRPLAVSTNQRLKDLPDVPTLKEKGINWPLESFYMLYASTNIDPELVKRLQTLLNQAYKQNASAYEAQGIQLDPTKNKDIEKFHFDTIRHYQNLKFPLDINEKS
jgi:tripartite-type tricarboxylate transporter receptor subunit TctC